MMARWRSGANGCACYDSYRNILFKRAQLVKHFFLPLLCRKIASLIVASFCQTLVAYAAANDKSAFSPNPSGITEFINFP
jgi:hypothetical protein